jgi:hypothetical protein
MAVPIGPLGIDVVALGLMAVGLIVAFGTSSMSFLSLHEEDWRAPIFDDLLFCLIVMLR